MHDPGDPQRVSCLLNSTYHPVLSFYLTRYQSTQTFSFHGGKPPNPRRSLRSNSCCEELLIRYAPYALDPRREGIIFSLRVACARRYFAPTSAQK